MRTERDAKGVLDEMKALGTFETDTALAEFLGVSKVTIASWRKRNSVPLDKCLLFSQKTMTDVSNILYIAEGYDHSYSQSNEWSTGVALHFIRRAQDNFLYGDKWQTSLWWGKTFPFLISYYETEVFDVAEKEDIELDEAAVVVMKTIDVLEPSDMIGLLEKRMSPKQGDLNVDKSGR